MSWFRLPNRAALRHIHQHASLASPHIPNTDAQAGGPLKLQNSPPFMMSGMSYLTKNTLPVKENRPFYVKGLV